MAPILIGGFVELRNVKDNAFNKSIYPFHNWRGFFDFSFLTYEKEDFNFSIGYEHESSHLTGGIVYNHIYDGKYRETNLNGLYFRLSFNFLDLKFVSSAIYYLQGYNRPEIQNLYVKDDGLEADIGFDWKKNGFLLSVFYRQVFNSKPYYIAELIDRETITTKTMDNLSAFNATSTLSIRAGYEIKNYGFYLKYLIGNPKGFYDSREIDNKLFFEIIFF